MPWGFSWARRTDTRTLPSLKLTYQARTGKWIFPLEKLGDSGIWKPPYFKRRTVSFREGSCFSSAVIVYFFHRSGLIDLKHNFKHTFKTCHKSHSEYLKELVNCVSKSFKHPWSMYICTTYEHFLCKKKN